MADYAGDERWTKKKLVSNAFRLGVLCLSWYVLSAAENIISKIILTDFPFPLTASISHSAFIAVVLGPILRVWKVPPNPSYRKKYYFYVIVPLAFGKVMASFTSQFSLSKVPVSYAHTVKASMPIFTVILSRLILRERNSWKIYCSLLPIVGGIAVATVTEISFNALGLISALVSTFSFSLQNIFSKKAMNDIGMHHLRLLHELCKVGVFFLLPVWLLTDCVKWTGDDVSVKSPGLLFLLLFIDCFCNFAHGMVAFTIISMISPLSYSVANATKRIVVITMSLLTLKNPVTSINVLGMSIAICGVLLYNKVKLDQARNKEILPTRSTASLHQLVSERYSSVILNHNSATLVPADNLNLLASPYNPYGRQEMDGNSFDADRTTQHANGHVPMQAMPDFPKHRYQNV